MEYEDETRRGKLQLIRDTLLVLELEGKPMKPTILMYAVRLNWGAMKDVVKQMNAKKLIAVTEPESTRRGRPLDRRSKARISVTLKGKYILRILDEMLRYLDDETPPQINPPLWLMRKALETKGFDFMGQLDNLQKLNLLEGPSHMDDLTPLDSIMVEKVDDIVFSVKPGSASLAEKEEVIFSLKAVNVKPPIHNRSILRHGAEELRAYLIVQQPLRGMYCPECGFNASGLTGLKIHVSHVHRDKKEKIMRLVLLAVDNRFDNSREMFAVDA